MADNERDPDEIEDEIEEGNAGLDDDEGGDEAETGQESPDAEAEEGQVDEPRGRGEKRFQKLANEVKAEREARAALEREMQALRAERAQRENTPKGKSPEDEQARLALMTTDERTDYKIAKAKREHDFAINVMRFQSADALDKAAYAAKAATNPRYKKYEAEVDQLLAQERRAGRDFPRETILSFVVGQKVLAGGGGKAKADAARRVQSQTARADSGRSDRAPQRRNENDNSLRALEKRLENQPI